MKLSLFLVLFAIIGFLMTAYVNCHQKRQESDGEDEDGPPGGGEESGPRLKDQVR